MPQERRDTVFNPDSWRDIEPEDRQLCTLRTASQFGEFYPLRTNGIIVEVERAFDGFRGTVHHDNVDWPKPVRVTLTKPRKTSAQRLLEQIEALLA